MEDLIEQLKPSEEEVMKHKLRYLQYSELLLYLYVTFSEKDSIHISEIRENFSDSYKFCYYKLKEFRDLNLIKFEKQSDNTVKIYPVIENGKMKIEKYVKLAIKNIVLREFKPYEHKNDELLEIAKKLKDLPILTIPRVRKKLRVSDRKAMQILYELEIKGILIHRDIKIKKYEYKIWEFREPLNNINTEHKEHNESTKQETTEEKTVFLPQFDIFEIAILYTALKYKTFTTNEIKKVLPIFGLRFSYSTFWRSLLNLKRHDLIISYGERPIHIELNPKLSENVIRELRKTVEKYKKIHEFLSSRQR